MGLEPVDGGDVILVSPMLVPLDSVANPPKEEPLPQGKQPPEDGKEPPEGAQGLEKPGVTLPSRKALTPDRKVALWKKFDDRGHSYEPLFSASRSSSRDTCTAVIDKPEANGVKVKNSGSMNLNSRQRWLGEHKDRLDEFLPRLSDLNLSSRTL